MAERLGTYGGEEIDDIREVLTPFGFYNLVTGKKKPAPASRFFQTEIDMLKDRLIEKTRRTADGLIDYGTGFLGERIGKRANKAIKESVYGSLAGKLIEGATEDYLKGYSNVDFTPVKYGSKELIETDKDGSIKKLLGKFKGKKAFYAEDIENAFGSNYETLLKESGLKKEQFNWAAKEYIKLHENNEYTAQKHIFRKGLSVDEHAKFEALLVKSLYNNRHLRGAADIYKVAMLIDSSRTDEFGRLTRQYISNDIDDIRIGQQYRCGEA